VDSPEIEIREGVAADRLTELMELFASEWWTASRTPGDVTAMLAASDLVLALHQRSTGGLVGFARVLTDGVYLAVVLDVIVASEVRGSGAGRMLLDAVVGHPRLAGVRSMELVCQPELVPFYRRWGFTERVGRSQLMRRSSDPVLVPRNAVPRQ
jgi:GNAT superfamily N-acetyltransferase